MKYNVMYFYKIGSMSSECQPYQRRVYLPTSFVDGKNALWRALYYLFISLLS